MDGRNGKQYYTQYKNFLKGRGGCLSSILDMAFSINAVRV